MTRRQTDAPGQERGSLGCGEAAWGWDAKAGGLGAALRLWTPEAGTPLSGSRAAKLDALRSGRAGSWRA